MKTIKLSESDLQRIVKRVIKEAHGYHDMKKSEMSAIAKKAEEEYIKKKPIMVNNLLQKINTLIKSSVERNLENIISTETVKFEFYDDELKMLSDTAKNFRGIKFTTVSKNNAGKFELRRPMMFTLIDSKDYLDLVERKLNDEEKPLFDEVGVVPKVKDKSVREMITDGKIAIVLERGNEGPSMMSWRNVLIGEKNACQGLNSFDELGDEIPITDILEKDKKICNGGTLISNSGVTLKVFKSPMNNIIKHNA